MPDRIIQSFNNKKIKILTVDNKKKVIEEDRYVEQNKVKPCLSFGIPHKGEKKFSLAMTETLRNDITKRVANLNEDFSVFCRDSIFEYLSINQEDINYYCEQALTRILHEKLGIDRKKKFNPTAIDIIFERIKRKEKEVKNNE